MIGYRLGFRRRHDRDRTVLELRLNHTRQQSSVAMVAVDRYRVPALGSAIKCAHVTTLALHVWGRES